MLKGDKSPRQYAYDYIRAKTKAEKAKAVQGCPDELKELVNSHVRIWRDRPKVKTEKLQDMQDKIQAHTEFSRGLFG